MGKRKWLAKISNWEQWPFGLLYAPLFLVWLWYCIRARAIWFFSTSNPTITFGGFEGEGKKEMYEQLPVGTYPKTIYIEPCIAFDEVVSLFSKNDFRYPVMAKPDVGMKGILCRKIQSEQELQAYHAQCPSTYLIQDLITLPVEVSVFYYRLPYEKKGTISGFFAKELMHVVGDGFTTLQALIEKHPKASLRMEEMIQRHEKLFSTVIPKGEIFHLSHAANHNRGALFISLKHEIDETLHAIFDELSHSTTFYYGRYDIKIDTVEALKTKRVYQIIEFNGCGAEPNHIYDCNMTLIHAYRELLKHWKMLYKISVYNHKQGVPYWSLMKGWNFLRTSNRHFKMLEQIDY